MLERRTKWRANRNARAARQLAEIATAIAALSDDDLLNLADISSGSPYTPLNSMAATEMERRKISL